MIGYATDSLITLVNNGVISDEWGTPSRIGPAFVREGLQRMADAI
jgi:hypothetical protein